MFHARDSISPANHSTGRTARSMSTRLCAAEMRRTIHGCPSRKLRRPSVLPLRSNEGRHGLAFNSVHKATASASAGDFLFHYFLPIPSHSELAINKKTRHKTADFLIFSAFSATLFLSDGLKPSRALEIWRRFCIFEAGIRLFRWIFGGE